MKADLSSFLSFTFGTFGLEAVPNDGMMDCFTMGADKRRNPELTISTEGGRVCVWRKRGEDTFLESLDLLGCA
jgi:hypothetical protein